MLSTGVRTDIGVKVFGPDLPTIERVCKEIETVVKPIAGARDAIAAPFMGKGYLQIDINREKAARYGITVEDIQNEIEVALGGRVVTYTVEKRDRYPGAHPLRPDSPGRRGSGSAPAGQPGQHGHAVAYGTARRGTTYVSNGRKRRHGGPRPGHRGRPPGAPKHANRRNIDDSAK